MNILPDFVRCRVLHRPNLAKVVDNVAWLFFDKILRMGLGLLVGVWAARYLGPEQFGLLNFAIAFSGLFASLATLGLQGIVVRDIVRQPESARMELGTAAILQTVGGVLSFLLILGFIAYLRPNDPQARLMVGIVGATILFKGMDIAVYWFESQVNSKYTVWVQNGIFLIVAVIKVLLILNDAPLIVFAWMMLFETGMAGIAMMVMMNKNGLLLKELGASWLQAKRLLKDSWPLALSGIAIMIYMKLDQIMLGQMIGDEAVGVFSAAVKISEIWYFIPMAIVASVFPTILETKRRSEEQYLRRLQKLYDLMVMGSVLVALPMTFLAPVIVDLLFGSAYCEAGTILAIHIWASIFVCLGVASGQSLLAEDRQTISLQRTFAGMLTNIALNLVLIPYAGAIGAAVSTVLAQAMAALFFDCLQKTTRNMFRMKIRTFNLSRIFKSYVLGRTCQ